MKCIITEQINSDGIELLNEFGEVDARYGISREELLHCISSYNVLIVRSDTPVDKELIDAGINLKVIGMAGVGLNHIDTKYAKEKGIEIFNVSDGSNDSVAELTVGMIINIARKINKAVKDTKNGIWNKTGYMGNQLKGKTLGLIAMGKIGSSVARICQSIGMDIIAYDPYLDSSIAQDMNVKLLSLGEVLSLADVISIHSPLTQETYHMIGNKQLSLMKKNAYIINLGRGGIIDEEALYDALIKNNLAGAALDVMEKEPPRSSKLFELENVIVTPHIGAGTIEAQSHIAISLSNKIIYYLNEQLAGSAI